MKTGILIHGCHLQAEEWENIVWGNPMIGILGRIPRGIQLAIQEKADLVYWGTGASEKDGLKEAEYTFQYAVSHISQLSKLSGLNSNEIDLILHKNSILDTKTQNTKEEIAQALKDCQSRKITRLILVSSPTHIARCLQTAEVLRRQEKLSGVEIFATASDTCYANSNPDDVFILEPPHRGDRPSVPLYKTLQGIKAIRKSYEVAQEFNKDLRNLILKWTKKL